MTNEWSNGIERARESDRHLAALLTSAMLSNPHQTGRPDGRRAASEAAHAVDLYRCVLAALQAVDEEDAETVPVSPTRDSSAMQLLDVSRDGDKFVYRTFRYDRLEDALDCARTDQARAQ
jgi:hypothetical protein